MSAQPHMQYTLPLTPSPVYGAENFVVSDSNREAMAWVQAWPEWEAQALIVTGPRASGKTHLARIWQERARACAIDAQSVEEDDIPALLAEQAAAVLEQADRVRSPATLLHLLNYARERSVFLLLTAAAPPPAWPYVLPDLTSRLAALPHAELRAPDDALLSALLTKLFADRQLSVDAAVITFLVQRIERSFAAAADAAQQLDRMALEQGRAVTMTLARQLLHAT